VRVCMNVSSSRFERTDDAFFAWMSPSDCVPPMVLLMADTSKGLDLGASFLDTIENVSMLTSLEYAWSASDVDDGAGAGPLAFPSAGASKLASPFMLKSAGSPPPVAVGAFGSGDPNPAKSADVGAGDMNPMVDGVVGCACGVIVLGTFDCCGIPKGSCVAAPPPPPPPPNGLALPPYWVWMGGGGAHADAAAAGGGGTDAAFAPGIAYCCAGGWFGHVDEAFGAAAYGGCCCC
jgi:hypothetical protein